MKGKQYWKRCKRKRANKRLVLTMPACRSFGIRARHNSWVVVPASFCRSRRWHGRTSEALALPQIDIFAGKTMLWTQAPIIGVKASITKTYDSFPILQWSQKST